PMELEIRVVERPEVACPPPTVEWLGLRLQNLPPTDPPVQSRRGLLVRDVLSPPLAAWLGLQQGDVLIALDGIPLNDVQQLDGSAWLSSSGEHLQLQVLR